MVTEVYKYIGEKKKIKDKLCLCSHCTENISWLMSRSCLSWHQGEECTGGVKNLEYHYSVFKVLNNI